MGTTTKVLFLGMALLGLGPMACLAQNAGTPAETSTLTNPTKTGPAAKKQKPATAQPTPPPPPLVLPSPSLPTQQLRQLGITQCDDVVTKMSNDTLNRQYDVQSGWHRDAPNQHVFQSVAILNSPQSTPPDGLTALVATPTPNGSCDGVALQVFPLAGDCPSVQKLMVSGGSAAAPLLNARVIFDRAGKRLFLVPGFNKTCIAVAVDSTFGVPVPPAKPPVQ